MGVGAGKGPAYGMPISPMSQYADKSSKKGAERMVIDAPALVDLGHGTIRYREEPKLVPGDGADVKTGYFYHARLTDYSEDATLHTKDEFKTSYIYQGPAKARGKSLYYVYGRGLNAVDQQQQACREMHRPQGRGYVWPSSYRNPNHFYYSLRFLSRDIKDESDDETEDVKTHVNPNLMRFVLHNDDTVDVLKKRIAVRLLIPSSIIFINYEDRELGNEDVIGDLVQSAEDGESERFSVELTRLV